MCTGTLSISLDGKHAVSKATKHRGLRVPSASNSNKKINKSFRPAFQALHSPSFKPVRISPLRSRSSPCAMEGTKIIVTLCVLLPGLPLYGLFTNHRKARKIGLPILISPISSFNPLWWVLGPFLFPIMKLMPAPISDWAYYGLPIWHFPDKHKTAARFGPA